MAIASVKVMVNDRLPFTAPSANDVIIERFRVQMTYLMQSQSLKDDLTVEVEAGYSALQNILFASMVCYEMISKEIMLTVAGNGTTAGTAAKTLKTAKADVVETEFQIVKASDGALLQMSSDLFLAKLLREICSMAQSIGWNCPFCSYPITIDTPFIVGEDFPPIPADIDAIFNGKIGN